MVQWDHLKLPLWFAGGGPSKAELSETDDEGQRSCLGMSETEESGTEAEDPPYNLNSPDSLQAVGLPEQFSALRVRP